MSSLRIVLKRLGNPLDWNEVERGILLMAIVIPMFFQITLWAWYIQEDPSVRAYIDLAAIRRVFPLDLLCCVTAVVLALAGLCLRQSTAAQKIYPHITAEFYAVSMCFFGYISGSFSFVAGLVMAGAPIFGFIIFERRVIYPAYAVATSLIFGFTYASAAGLLPYGPVFHNNLPVGIGGMFWYKSILFFSVTQLVSLVWLADSVIRRWKQRELEVKTLSLRDPLTGISNRRHITQHLAQEIARAQRHHVPLSVVILDIDHFKRINDSWGHPAGDQVLQMAAHDLAEVLRQHDAVGRYGGEEFMLVLAADADGARILAERCRQRLENLSITLASGDQIGMTASFGICTLGAGIATAEAMIRLADDALYRAKGAGRNRVEVAPLPVMLH